MDWLAKGVDASLLALLWAGLFGGFGLSQIWVSVIVMRGHLPRPPRSDCVVESLRDGNLFAFTLATAGSVIAALSTEIPGGKFPNRTMAIIASLLAAVSLGNVIVTLVVWTRSRSMTPAGTRSIAYRASNADIKASARCALFALVLALGCEFLPR